MKKYSIIILAFTLFILSGVFAWIGVNMENDFRYWVGAMSVVFGASAVIASIVSAVIFFEE